VLKKKSCVALGVLEQSENDMLDGNLVVPSRYTGTGSLLYGSSADLAQFVY
jgi:hypothetical protein